MALTLNNLWKTIKNKETKSNSLMDEVLATRVKIFQLYSDQLHLNLLHNKYF